MVEVVKGERGTQYVERMLYSKAVVSRRGSGSQCRSKW